MVASSMNGLISVLHVANQEKALKFYTQLLGGEADIVPTESVAEWQLTKNAWIQVTCDPDKPEGIGKTSIIVGLDKS